MKSASVRVFSIRDLIPRPELDMYGERQGSCHQLAQNRLKVKHRSLVAEQTISAHLSCKGQTYQVTGRIDGIFKTRCGMRIVEIKSVPGAARLWVGRPELEAARWQLRLYADLYHLWQVQSGLRSTTVEASLLLVGSNGVSAEELIDLEHNQGILTDRLNWLDLKERLGHHRTTERIQRLHRFVSADSQTDREIQGEAWRFLGYTQADRILLSLPPGSGKTRIALRAGLLMAARLDAQLWWITMKATGRDEVLSEVTRYGLSGLPLRTVWKTLPHRVCRCDCPGDQCPRKMATALKIFRGCLSGLAHEDGWNPDRSTDFSEREGLCPHKISQELEYHADVVIADFNYLLFAERDHGHAKRVLVMDEAQNLSERFRAHTRVKMSLAALMDLLRLLPVAERRACRGLLRINRHDEYGADEYFDHWAALLSCLRRNAVPEAHMRSLQQAVGLWRSYPNDFRLLPFQGEGDRGWVGVLLNSDRHLTETLSRFDWILALSGSVIQDAPGRAFSFPMYNQFQLIEIAPAVRASVAIVPILRFRHPISLSDIDAAVGILEVIRRRLGGAVAVFGQSRASNAVVGSRLVVRGFSVLLDEDIGEEWTTAELCRPDFLFIALGGSLAESVNPPSGLFTAAAVLSPGYRPPDPLDDYVSALSREQDCTDTNESPLHRVQVLAASRIIQAVGRLHRAPSENKPVFLLNRDFATEEYLRLWPRHWYARYPNELVFSSFEEALDEIAGRALAG